MESQSTMRRTDSTITVKAPAKVNLTLEILGKRHDGYHEVRSLMQAIDLCDSIMFEPAEGVSLVCNEPELQSDDNLVLKAADLLGRAAGCNQGARITLQKNIPWAAGLGGGSSDAAATLKALNQLWRLGLTPSELARLGARLGSDVPFFIYGGLALAEGRGEKISPFLFRPDNWFVLLVPSVPRMERKTAMLYAALRPQWFTQGECTDRLVTFLEAGLKQPWPELCNVFEKAAPQVFQGIEELWRLANEATDKTLHLSGSGPASFVLCKEKEEAVEVWRKLTKAGLTSLVSRAFYETPPGDGAAD
ncbi:MAG: 4-(cytidine 5'-diphospho)-2-C-methyl-D-erythritol kinase [Chloroflexi bacterium]|nr:4-(cytidine 5'-diphospho)-2-C-methyl-D-erythritol kinase [Chloroflexota bacterium]